MISMFKLFIKQRELIFNMARKDIIDRYISSTFGLAWAVLHPLILSITYILVFNYVFRVKVMPIESAPNLPGSVQFSLYLLSGFFPWICLSEGMVRASISIFSNANIVKQVVFPTEILPIYGIVSSFLNVLIGFIIIILMILIFVHRLSWWVFLLPIPIITQFLFMAGVGWILAVIGTYIRDTKDVLQAGLLIGVFVTPVFFDEKVLYAAGLPNKLVWAVLNLNPFAHLLNMYRDILYYGQIQHPWSFVVFSLSALIIAFLGYRFFNKTKIAFGSIV